jgi:NADH-quinone oxidoreductase subunit H
MSIGATRVSLATMASVLALASAGCSTAEVRDTSAPGLTRVTPNEISAGGTLEVTGHALAAYADSDLTVTLNGAFVEPGGEAEQRVVHIPAEYGSAGRVFATLKPEHIAALGARTLRFAGTLTLSAAGPRAPAKSLSLQEVKLELFPPDVQRAMVQYEVWRSERAVSRALGLMVRTESPDSFEKPLPGGVVVLKSHDRASAAGLLKGDRLVALNGAPLRSYAQFRLAALDAHDHAHYRILRGDVFELEVPKDVAAGLQLEAAKEGPGIIVKGVRARSAAWIAGIQSGDRLISAGSASLFEGDAEARAVAAKNAIADGGPVATLTTWRGELLRADLSIPSGAHLAPPWLVGIILLSVICTVVLLGFVAPFGGIATFMERRIAGRMQSRIGPNRVGPQGLLQFLADGLKLLQKEDLIPGDADPILFRIAPYLVFLGVFMTFAVLPFSSTLVAQNLNIGVLYVLSVTSIVVVGILMSGWASNNKWSLLGGMRSAAQIVSYEIPASLAVLPVVLTAGSLSMQEVIRDQGGMPWEWNLFGQPALLICFFIFFVSALAEGNRTPFDLPEAESELVNGFNTEYSGMRFSMMALGEFANIYVIAAITVTLFLGGWRLPTLGPVTIDGWRTMAPTLFGLLLGGGGATLVLFASWGHMWKGVPTWYGTPARVGISLLGLGILAAGAALHAPEWLGMEVLRLVVFQAKALFLVFVVMWIRWTLPRLRVDQMMNLCWKYFVPFAIGSFLFTTLWVAYAPEPLRIGMRATLTACGALFVIIFVRKSVRTFRATRSVLYANPFV